MLTILHKEITVFFSSLIAYSAVGIFLLTTGLFLWIFPDTNVLVYGYASLDSLFAIAPYTFTFLIPAITMRSIAAEKKEGTFELLTTHPVSDWDIVLGKYLACILIIVLALIPTFLYYFTIYQLGLPKGNIDTGAIIGSYIGLLLLGSTFAALGIFASSVSKNEVIAFIIAVFLCFLTFDSFDYFGQILSLQDIAPYLSMLSINEHYQSISRGVLDTRDLFYFLSIIILFLAITKTVLGSRKW